MRHLKAGRKFGRTSAHRKALFKNLVGALIEKERISTTLAKAKELRGKVEKTITLGKRGTLHARRQAFKLVPAKDAVQKVFGPLAERYASRPGGYTRIIRVGHRKGDDAPMAFIELVDRNGEEKTGSKAKAKSENVVKDSKPKANEKSIVKESKTKSKQAVPKKDKAPAVKKKSDSKKNPQGKPEAKEKK
jgi:large subunit ribosomal protein L17